MDGSAKDFVENIQRIDLNSDQLIRIVKIEEKLLTQMEKSL